jgi:predicted NUDIX family phosphoesterase
MSKEDQQIIVVQRNDLFRENYFEGFQEHNELDYESRIIPFLKIMRRGDAEINPDYKQPIGYMIVVDPLTEKIYAYQRSSKDEHYTEKRLQGKMSWGVGGHIEPADNTEGKNPIRESRLRELSEEIEISGNLIDIKTLGYINDDSDLVGKVHFGILYLVEINGTAKPKDKEMFSGNMYSLSELENICNSSEYNVENWSKIALEPLKIYFQSHIHI